MRNMFRQDGFDYESFGHDAKIKRVIAELRQEDLAAELGVVRSTISKVERGGVISPFTIWAIAQKFDMNVLEYCTVQGKPAAKKTDVYYEEAERLACTTRCCLYASGRCRFAPGDKLQCPTFKEWYNSCKEVV